MMLMILAKWATIQDGFSEVKNIQISKSHNVEDDAGANIGTSNLFALLSVGIKGNHKTGNGENEVINDLNVVLPTDENYFLNKNMNEITDGNYKILGKVVQICSDDGEISLLRNTVFSKLQLDKMKDFQSIFDDESLKPFAGEDGLVTAIKAPVIMVIPIAIYI